MNISVETIIKAISIASDHTQNRSIQAEAIQYLNHVRSVPDQSWPIALNIFVATRTDGGRAHDPQSRLFALQIIDDFLDNRVEPFSEEDFNALQQTIMNYIQAEYVFGSAEESTPFIRNKFSHTLSLLFTATYPNQWPSFFPSFFALLRSHSAQSSTAPPSPLNPNVSLLFLHLMIEISAEVADNMLKSARNASRPRLQRDSRLRDALREKDAPQVSEAVLAIITEGEERLASVRREGVARPAALEDIVGLGMRTFASIVPWIDINLTVTPHTLRLLFRLLSDPASPIRLETSLVLLRIVQKGMKYPGDKLQLIRVLSLGEVLQSLEAKTRVEGEGERHDAEVSYREGLARLADGLGEELIKLVEEESLPGDVRANAEQLLDQLLPTTLRFMADDYDDISTAVFTSIQALFASYKRSKKTSPNAYLTAQKRKFLSSLLEVILQKMKWDPSQDPDEMDEEELLAFDKMRKDLRTFLDALLAIDEELVTGTVLNAVVETLRGYDAGEAVQWQDAELAVHIVFFYGELQKSNRVTQGRQAFILLPPNFTSLDKEARKEVDLNSLPLNVHGQMLLALIQSNISQYPHSAVLMQYFEAVARYGEFFKLRKECVPRVLEAFVTERGIHNPDTSLRGRIFYLLHRFIKDTKDAKSEFYAAVSLTLIERIRPVLDISVELPEPESPEQDLLDEAIKTPGLFDNQLYLFESVGTLVSVLPNQKELPSVLQAVLSPLLVQLSQTLQTPRTGPQDVLPVLRAHHLIRALGSVAKGFPDAPVPTPKDYTAQPWIAAFNQVAEAILVSLEVLDTFKAIREAGRFAFARLIATGGASTTQYIPTLMNRLLVHFDQAELIEFTGFLGLVMHKLQSEVFDVVDTLLSPLQAHIVNLLAQPIDGMDAKQTHVQVKRAYLDLLMAITGGKLAPVLTSEKNRSQFEPIVESIINLAMDTSDPVCQKIAFALLGRLVTNFGSLVPPEGQSNGVNGHSQQAMSLTAVPGFDRVIYESIVPLAFDMPASPSFNISDGVTFSALGELGLMLKTIQKVRGDELSKYLADVYLPAKNWPSDLTQTFVVALRDSDNKVFKKSWQDFVKSIHPRA